MILKLYVDIRDLSLKVWLKQLFIQLSLPLIVFLTLVQVIGQVQSLLMWANVIDFDNVLIYFDW